jgi:hypothetical protein
VHHYVRRSASPGRCVNNGFCPDLPSNPPVAPPSHDRI